MLGGAEHLGGSLRYEVAFGAGADGGLEIGGWDEVDLGAGLASRGLTRPRASRPMCGGA